MKSQKANQVLHNRAARVGAVVDRLDKPAKRLAAELKKVLKGIQVGRRGTRAEPRVVTTPSDYAEVDGVLTATKTVMVRATFHDTPMTNPTEETLVKFVVLASETAEPSISASAEDASVSIEQAIDQTVAAVIGRVAPPAN